MAHVFERFITNTKEVEITDCLCEAVLSTMVYETPRVIADPDNYEARANIMWAGMVAHNNIVGVGRAQDWNSHGIEHELSALYDCAHGGGLADKLGLGEDNRTWGFVRLSTKDIEEIYRIAANAKL